VITLEKSAFTPDEKDVLKGKAGGIYRHGGKSIPTPKIIRNLTFGQSMFSQNQITSFHRTHHFYEGLRATIGIMAPVLLAARFEQIGWGLAMAVGALCVSLADNAGPVHHRVNGMLITLGFILVSSLLAGYLVPFKWLFVSVLFLFGCFFSFIGIFGNRAASIGTAALVAITLQLADTELGVWQNALLVAAGGLWYFILSLALYRLRPYKLAQQVLGDCLEETAGYLRLKANFFEEKPDFDNTYNALLGAQVRVHNKQEAVREILFKTRSIVKESTHTGRVLVLLFLETVDLFEAITKSETTYRELHNRLNRSAILPKIADVLNQLADALTEMANDIKDGKPFPLAKLPKQDLALLKEYVAYEKESALTIENTSAFESLERIMANIVALYQRTETIGSLSSYQSNIKINRQIDYQRFVIPSYINLNLLKENISLQSNIFRYSIRMGLALASGYVFSLFFPLGHSYWILLTIVVILKPAYALTTQRNKERLWGTVIGGITGLLILKFIPIQSALLIIMIVCMILAFSFMRIRYMLSVAMLTAYVLIGLYLLQPGEYTLLVKDRIIDTAIGSLIAFVFTRLIPPKWEREQLLGLLKNAIETNKDYFSYLISTFEGKKTEPTQYKWYRKETYVALANVSDAFQRMLNEPKREQQSGIYLHPLIVSCHVLTSMVASLSGYYSNHKNATIALPLIELNLKIITNLNAIIALLSQEKTDYDVENKETASLTSNKSKEIIEKEETKDEKWDVQDSLGNTIARQLQNIHDLSRAMLELTMKLKADKQPKMANDAMP
jgi:uncharacterized membrane protein (TIGR01666 family)